MSDSLKELAEAYFFYNICYIDIAIWRLLYNGLLR